MYLFACKRAQYPLIFLVACLTACRDPNVLKKKYLANGDKYYALGKFHEASIMYRRAIKQDPRYGDAYLHQGRTALKINSPVNAAAALLRAVELLPEGPDRVEARVTLAGVYLVYLEAIQFEKRLADDVDRLADDLIALDPKSFDGYRIRGRLASLDAASIAGKLPELARSRLQEAISALRTADSIRPFEKEILVSLGRSLWAAGQPGEAEKLLNSAIERHKDLAVAYSELARFYARTGRAADGERLLKKAIENNPKEYSFQVELANLYRFLGRRADVTRTLDTLKTHASDYPAAFEVAGKSYLAEGDFRQAIREYEQGITAFPKYKAGYQKLIVEALNTGDRRSEAEVVNESILKDHPKDTDAIARRAGWLLEKGEIDKAIVQLESMLRQDPNHYLLHYNMGRALLAKGRREEARFQFSESIRLSPNFIPARFAIAEVQLATGEYDKTVLTAEQILSLDEKNPQALLLRAIGLREMNKPEAAREGFDSLLRLYPRFEEGHLQLGKLNERERKFKEAETEYRKSYEVNPGNLGGLLAIVKLHTDRNRFAEALKLLNEEQRKRPDRADLLVALADTEMQAGHLDVATAHFQRLLKSEKDPKALGLNHVRIAECYKRSGDFESAITHLQTARQLLPDSSMVLHNLGVLHDIIGKKDQAKTFYEASLKLNGEDGTVLNNLAYYMAENGGDLDQALTYAQKARQKMPNELAFADTLGIIYLKKNLVANALEILEDLVRKKPADATFRRHLGEALLQKGDKAKGKKELQTALASSPSAEDATKIKKLLAKTGT